MTRNAPYVSYDTHSREALPNANFKDVKTLSVSNISSARQYSFLFFGGFPPPGATVLLAELRVYLKTNWSGGPHPVTAKRITSSWKESKLTWNLSPTVTATNAVTTNVSSGVDKQLVTFDVTNMINDVMNGGAWQGVRLETSSAGAVRNFYSSEGDPRFRPRLVIDWSRKPLSPNDQSPAGGRIISAVRPILRWNFRDPDGDGQQSYEIQLDAANDFTTGIDYDSGWVSSTQEQFDDVANNWLTGEGSFETGTEGWTALTNCTVTQSSAQSLDGAFSLRMSSTASGDMQTVGPAGTSAMPAVVGGTYYGQAVMRAGSTGRTCTARLRWYNSGGTFLSETVGTGAADTNTGWQTITVSGVAPASTAFVMISTFVAATGAGGELHYVDEAYVSDIPRTPRVNSGNSMWWRVRARDANGLTSPWSDSQQWTRQVKGVLTITSPPDGGTVDEGTPTIITTLTTEQNALDYQLYVEEDGEYVKIWDAPYFSAPSPAGVAYSFTLPPKLIRRTLTNYRLAVESFDVFEREGIPSDPPFVRKTSTFTFVRTSGISAVTTITATAQGSAGQPGVKIRFNRAAGQGAPDYWCLNVDGDRIFTRIDPADISLGGDPIIYEFVYYGSKPFLPHTYEMEPVTLNAGKYKHGLGNATATFTPKPSGAWFVREHDLDVEGYVVPRRFRLMGNDDPDLVLGDDGALLTAVGRRDPVRIVNTVRGLEGSVSGVVRTDDPVSGAQCGSPSGSMMDNVWWAMKEKNVGEVWRLIVGGYSILVGIDSLSAPTHWQPSLISYPVTVGVHQVGDWLT